MNNTSTSNSFQINKQVLMKNTFTLLTFICAIVLTLPTQAGSHEDEHKHDYSIFSEKETRIDNPSQQAQLRQSASWQAFETKHGHWYAEFNVLTSKPMRAAGKGIQLLPTGDLAAKSLHFIQTELADYKFPINDLRFHKINSNDRYSVVNFKQQYKGLEILNSSVALHVATGEKVSAFTANVFDAFELNTVASITPNAIETFATNGLSGTIHTVIVSPDLKVLPIPTKVGYEFKLVYEVSVKGKADFPFEYRTLLDAHTGQLYTRQNRVCSHSSAASYEVKGDVKDNASQPTQSYALPNMRVRIAGTDYFTDANGVLEYDGALPVSATVFLQGPFCRTLIGEVGNTVPSYEVTIEESVSEIVLPASADLSAVSAFYHVNVVHDFMRAELEENFDDIDFPIVTRVEIEGSCNAYYDGSLNFLQQGTCWPSAQMGDIVYHEYGHGINYDYYNYLGGYFDNGSVGEGYADVWGLAITGNPILAQGFTIGSTNSSIRRYDQNPKRYPEDLTGQVHDNGEIIAGAWWDLGQMIGLEAMFDIFVDSHLGIPMRPDGQEGALYSDILFQALLADDDNGDLTDGSPNSNQIIEAFDMHGIVLQIAADIAHEPIPVRVPDALIQIDFDLDIDFNYTPFVSEVGVRYKANDVDTYQFTNGVILGTPTEYLALLPSYPAGTVVEYYFELQDNLGGASFVSPFRVADDNSNVPHYLLVGFSEKAADNFFGTADQWTLGADDDDADTGHWEIGSPNATTGGGGIVQTGTDHTPTSDNFCAFTGNASPGDGVGVNDVDAGKVTLTSPAFNVVQFIEPTFSYWRWFTNDQGANPENDNLEVEISNDGENWVYVENMNVPDHSWRMVAFKVRDYVIPTSTVFLRFTASDNLIPSLDFNGGSLVELAIDDIALYDLDLGVGIENLITNNALNIYPNPATEKLVIEQLPEITQAATVQLYNVVGQKMYEQAQVQLHSANHVIDVSNLAAGMYLLQVQAEGQTMQQKIVIE